MSISPRAYFQELASQGGSRALALEIRKIDTACRSRGVRPVYTLGHLAKLSGVPYPRLRNMISSIANEYSEHEMQKKSGVGTRTIRMPSRELKQVQRYILKSCLPAHSGSDISHAYSKGRGILTAAREHVGARAMVLVDLAAFFDSVKGISVYRIFSELGYPELLSLEMMLLCTAGGAVEIVNPVGKGPYSFSEDRFLPQGAPTSGALSNLALRRVDEALEGLQLKGLTVTRYADDIALSSSSPLDRQRCAAIVAEVTDLCRSQGFSINPSKTKILLNKSTYRVLGLSVGRTSVGLSRMYKRRLESEVRGIAVFGLAKHSLHRGYSSEIEYIAFLWGHIAFAKGIDFTWGSGIESKVRAQHVPFLDVVQTMA